MPRIPEVSVCDELVEHRLLAQELFRYQVILPGNTEQSGDRDKRVSTYRLERIRVS